MRILTIIGASTDDERTALCELMSIWEQGGTCSDALQNRLPIGRADADVASNPFVSLDLRE
jgi:hypothetical protein